MSDQYFREKYGRRPYAWDPEGNVLRYEEFTDEQARDRYLQHNAAYLGMAGMFGGGLGFATGMGRDDFRSGIGGDFVDRLAEIKKLDFRLDPELKDAWLHSSGPYDSKLNRAAEKAIALNIPQDADDYIRPDLSQAGGYKKALDAYNKSQYTQNLTSLGTVTPGPESSRFGAELPEEPDVSTDSGGIKVNARTGRKGGREASMLWANDGELQYLYSGRHGSNPSVHFSGAELKPEERGRYLYTGEALQEAEDGGRTTWGRKSKAPSSDVMFGSETRKIGGLTTAADVFADLQRRGINPPLRGTMDSAAYLQTLSEQLADATNQTPYQALESLASPHPVSGSPGRTTGTIPETLEFRFANATDDQLARVGLSSNGIFEPNTDPFDGRHLSITGQVPSDQHIQLKDVPVSAMRRSFRRPMGGLLGTATQSEDVAQSLRKGDYGEAAFRAASAFTIGEVIGQSANQGLKALAKRGITQPAAAMAGAGQVLGTPAAAIGALDAVTTLASGKNSRELLVDSGNTGPAVAASMAPITGAPLGMAGGPVQGNVPKKQTAEQTRAQQAALADNVSKARNRPGRWRLAGFNIPDFGISEWYGIN